jgi:hypothetical protein
MTPADIRFAADGMLQSLATWLRVLGYDCLAGRDLFGRRLLEEAVAGDRVFLTRNTHLQNDWPHALLERASIFYVASEALSAQLREVVAKFALDWKSGLFTRCVRCNAMLERAARSEVLAGLPPVVAAHERDFWQCGRCRKVFWHGTHVRDSVARLERWLGA